MPSGAYTTAQVGEVSVGGIMKMPDDAPPLSPPWGCYVTVGRVEDTVAAAQSLGGKVLAPVMDVPGMGCMAVLQGPQGAVLSVITYAMPSG